MALGNYRIGAADPVISISQQREEFSIGVNAVGDAEFGWFPVTLDTDTTAPWKNDGLGDALPANPFALGLRLTSGRLRTVADPGALQQAPSPCDFLIAFDYVLADIGTDSASAPVKKEHAGVALPTTSTTTAWEGEQATVKGFSCGSNWTIQLAGEVPDDAWDHTDEDRTADRVLCTLTNSDASASISVVLDTPTNAIIFKCSDGTSKVFKHTSPKKFYFLRGSPILLGIRRSGSTYSACVSVGCSEVIGPAQLQATTSFDLKPAYVRYGDASSSKVQPMLWHGGRIDDSTALSDSAMTASLQNLGMIYQRTVPLPPGPLPS